MPRYLATATSQNQTPQGQTTQRSAVAQTQSSVTRFAVIVLLLFGLALRLYRLGAESLWYDETVSAYLASQPLGALIAHTARDIHPPAYYVLLYLWRWLSQPTVAFGLEYLYAWPSLCLDILAISLIHIISKRSFGPKVALWALALATIQPVQIWYAQEVRMYSLGAFALLLSLWAVLPLLMPGEESPKPIGDGNLPRQTLILYPIAALLGLYTLYYYLFWLVALNVAIGFRLWKNGHALRAWIVLQILVITGWLPWLPVFLHQVLTPPVPAWRVPWQNIQDIARSLNEGLAAYWIGHIPPLLVNWPWALVNFLIAATYFVYAKSTRRSTRALWLVLCFGPLLLLDLVSVAGPPIYHVRYVATYAPVFVILLAVLLADLPRFVAPFLLIMVVTISALSLNDLWTNPLYAADDHRGAVAALAQQWRPGDTILVNAGWAYTALSVYWPTQLSSPDASRPPALAGYIRLNNTGATPSSPDAPFVVRTGSVDGSSTLGWGSPASDFFPISAQETGEAMQQLAATHRRIWHYRIYDTVSDPQGVIRGWLTDNTIQESSQPIPGRDYLRLESYQTTKPSFLPSPTSPTISFPDAKLTLTGYPTSTNIAAGETLYLDFTWTISDTEAFTTTPAISLRLYDASGRFLLQSDTPLNTNPPGSTSQSFALPIPADTIPGNYKLALVLYAPDTLAPYPVLSKEGAALPSPTELGDVTIGLPLVVPHTYAPLVSFDYIDLLKAEVPATPLTPGASFDTAWIWRPQESSYRDRYRARLNLFDGDAKTYQLADVDLGSDSYPSSSWPALYPLKQYVTAAIPADLRPGNYELDLDVYRVADGKMINAIIPWYRWPQLPNKIGEIQIVQP